MAYRRVKKQRRGRTCSTFLQDCRARMTNALIALGSYLAVLVLFLHWWARFPR